MQNPWGKNGFLSFKRTKWAHAPGRSGGPAIQKDEPFSEGPLRASERLNGASLKSSMSR